MKKPKRRKRVVLEKDIKTMNCVLFGIFVLLLMFMFLDTTNTDDAIKCKKIKGEYCTNYEIEKYVRRGNK